MTAPTATTPLTVADVPRLVAGLTLAEKAALCSGQDFWTTQPVDRLGIPAVMVTDGPHGLRKQAGASDHVGLNESVPATCFPPAAGLASTWDRGVIRRVGEALGAETRGNAVGVLLGPGVNMKRSPLCGRNFEYFSEDPFLAGELATDLVDGIQSRGVGTSLKHFAANNQETDRMRVSAEIDERTLREIYLPAFERVVTGAQPWTVMCSYNKINGTYASQDPWLLTDVLRGDWGFEGLVVSDWGAVDDRVTGLAAGLDLEMPSSAGVNDARIVAAVEAGELDESVVDLAATRVLTMVARAAEAVAEPGTYDVAAHHALAHEAATRTAVLLKNDHAVLPLDPARAGDLVVIGEMARTPRYQGAGSSQVNPTRLVSALDALAERDLDVPFHPGYLLAEAAGKPGQDRDDADADATLRAEAVAAAAGRTAVLFVGLPAVAESEGYDRDHMELPEAHVALVREVSAVARRTVVVLSNGSAVTVSGWQDGVDAILETWLGGQASGSAAVALLLGEAAPSGRLAESIPVALSDVPAQLNFPGENGTVRYGEGLFIGYRGLDATGADVSYPFGHGLTYTTFDHSDLAVDVDEVTASTAAQDAVVRVAVTVTNTGERAGVAVPQLYLGRPASAVARAPRELRGFEAVALEPGESRRVELTVSRRGVSHWDTVTHGWVVEPGALEVAVGASSRDLPLVTTVELVAPPLPTPLHRYSTVAEWQQHPEAWEALVSAIGPAAQMFDAAQGDPAHAAMFAAIPVVKVTTMGFSDTLTPEAFDDLLATYGEA
ncbi:glycoside hydrolase family 3 C-terminal domain-containing protein [Isoptericola aurantiacus]|uniref:glycoside hydrolase family 3 C-terminal domain-containing protein n=1 Tax=Isoptericola aurantiacus TaxID=3377839 RepID=UPI00383A1AA2